MRTFTLAFVGRDAGNKTTGLALIRFAVRLFLGKLLRRRVVVLGGRYDGEDGGLPDVLVVGTEVRPSILVVVEVAEVVRVAIVRVVGRVRIVRVVVT